MDQQSVFLVMLGMLVVTYLPRLIPLLLFSSRDLPPIVVTWLRYVPAAVLSAMLFPSLVILHDRVDLSFDNLFFWAAFPTLVVAVKTKSLFGAVVIGMLVVALVRAFFGL